MPKRIRIDARTRSINRASARLNATVRAQLITSAAATVVATAAAIVAPVHAASVNIPIATGNTPSQEGASWWMRSRERQVGSYTIRTDLSAADSTAVTRHLLATYDMIDAFMGHMPPRSPELMDVLIFGERADYEAVMRRRYRIDVEETGGLFFDGPSGRALAIWIGGRSDVDLARDLQHEAFHQYAYSRFGHDLPMWVNEGMATYFGEAIRTESGFILGQADIRPVRSIRAAVSDKQALSFMQMLTLTNDQWLERLDQPGGENIYDQAWSMVEFLLHADGERYKPSFGRFLNRLREGHLPPQAFNDAFGMNVYEAFEKRWAEWVRDLKPTSLATAVTHARFLAEGMLFLRRNGVEVTSFEALQKQLEADAFEWTAKGTGTPLVIKASDNAAFQIPRDGAQSLQPVFELTPRPPHTRSAAERALDERFPMPYTIQTVHLKPARVRVVFKRFEEEPSLFSYTIEVR